MSHFVTIVFTNGKNTVNELLAPYDEGISVPTVTTKQEFIYNERKRIEEYKNGIYAVYLKDPVRYAENHSDSHVRYLEEEFPLELKWDDETCYRHAIRYIDEENIHEDGSVFSLYNKNAKWDWYEVGGGWTNILHLLPKTGFDVGNDADVDEVDFKHKDMRDFVPHAAVTPNGEWHEPGRMGWWGMSDATQEDEERWVTEYKKILGVAKKKKWHMTVVDCHI